MRAVGGGGKTEGGGGAESERASERNPVNKHAGVVTSGFQSSLLVRTGTCAHANVSVHYGL